MATKGNHEKETGIAFTQEKGDHYSLVINPLKKIKDYTLECIFPDSNAVTWFGGFDGLIRFDASCSSEDTLKFNTLLRSVVIGKDSFVFAGDTFFTDPTSGVIEQIIPEFRYRYNHVKFVFAAPFHIRQEDVSYQCYLEGFDKDWQPWTSSNVRDYTFLPEGSYVFHVRAKNIYGTMTEDVKYSFNIKPPLYRHWLAYILYLTALLAFIYMLLKWRSFVDAQERIKLERLLAERTEELVKQKERAEELVANILPKDTAQELVSKGHATRKKYKMVTVLFSDVQGFTQIAEHMNPEKLLDELDRFFLYFDSVVERLGVEKIKTIGDAYMCAGGIPVKNRTNPIDVILGALEIQQYMKILKSQSQNEWDIRIGIHTGPVIAGVVGSKKYTYDIWGDTVNIASRMESTGEAGEINISESTFELVKDYFECEYRGKLPVKYKGEIDMYFVKGILPELSENRDMIHPNREFLSKLQLLRFSDLEELIMTKLDKGLPKNLYYHNVKHTIDVMVQTEILAISERVTREEMLLLKTASLFHDTGFLIGYDDHEFLSIKMAKDILPQYMYSEEQIAVICDLIFVTKLPPVPRNKLEMIMCDADLDYLGRNDFIPVSQNLFREMYERGKIRSIEEWNRQQYSFISQHNYFTETAQKIREVNKQEVLKELKKMIE
jgi:class 3 adenylate cyclase